MTPNRPKGWYRKSRKLNIRIFRPPMPVEAGIRKKNPRQTTDPKKWRKKICEERKHRLRHYWEATLKFRRQRIGSITVRAKQTLRACTCTHQLSEMHLCFTSLTKKHRKEVKRVAIWHRSHLFTNIMEVRVQATAKAERLGNSSVFYAKRRFWKCTEPGWKFFEFWATSIFVRLCLCPCLRLCLCLRLCFLFWHSAPLGQRAPSTMLALILGGGLLSPFIIL